MTVPQVRVLASAQAAVPLLLDEVRGTLSGARQPLLGFATGGTYAAFLRALGAELAAGRVSATAFVATHLDEYLGFEPARRGGMVHELCAACPAFDEMLSRGTFLPVPHDGEPASLRAHADRLQRAGGVSLQFLGVGRNGHLAFNEPGTSWDRGFHVATLAETTREDARPRFAPDEPPRLAVTAGPASILGARRLVVCAFGHGKAEAVRAMLRGPMTTSCPAAAIRHHANVLVLLDTQAAGALDGAGAGSAGTA
ncbi:MAG TPA: 6-phosphogluconolactonase [Planctomycetota bacterium]|nr:6-phosphogluconolactonase [Planctomycetota bacterium]